MENISKLKKYKENALIRLSEIDNLLNSETEMIKQKALNYEKKELINSIDNIDKYLKKIELIEKVKQYENSSRNC